LWILLKSREFVKEEKTGLPVPSQILPMQGKVENDGEEKKV